MTQSTNVTEAKLDDDTVEYLAKQMVASGSVSGLDPAAVEHLNESGKAFHREVMATIARLVEDRAEAAKAEEA